MLREILRQGDRLRRNRRCFQVVAVAGSSLGLLTVGWLADRVGGIGQAMAIVAIAPALLVLVVMFWFPETARRELEDLNPSDRAHPAQ